MSVEGQSSGGLREAVKLAVGQLAEAVLPSLAREIDDLRNPDRAPRLKRAILYARLRRAHRSGDPAAVEAALRAFWRYSPGNEFHSRFAEDRFQVFRQQHAAAVDQIKQLARDNGFAVSRVVEIGCGDGQVLAYCARQLPDAPEFIGLDINAAVIAEATRAYADDRRLAFVNADACDWLNQDPKPGTVMISNGGVLEYVSPENVDRLFAAVAEAAPAAILLVEPAAPDHDFATQAGSFVFGKEGSFSHNHRHRLTQAGFEIVLEQETPAFGARLISTIGFKR